MTLESGGSLSPGDSMLAGSCSEKNKTATKCCGAELSEVRLGPHRVHRERQDHASCLREVRSHPFISGLLAKERTAVTKQ